MNTSRVWMLGGVVLAIAIFAGAYVIGVAPALASAEKADKDVISVEGQNTVQRNELARLEELANSSEDIADELAELQTAIPANHLMADYDRRLEALAIPFGITLLEITYSDELPAAAVSTDPAVATDGAAVPTGLVAVPIQIKTEGDLAQTIHFLKTVQLGDRYLSILSITLTAASGSGQVTNIADMTINGYTFVLPQDAPGGAPAVVADPAAGAASG